MKNVSLICNQPLTCSFVQQTRWLLSNFHEIKKCALFNLMQRGFRNKLNNLVLNKIRHSHNLDPFFKWNQFININFINKNVSICSFKYLHNLLDWHISAPVSPLSPPLSVYYKEKSSGCKEKKNNQCDPFSVSEQTTYSQLTLLILLDFVVKITQVWF